MQSQEFLKTRTLSWFATDSKCCLRGKGRHGFPCRLPLWFPEALLRPKDRHLAKAANSTKCVRTTRRVWLRKRFC